jgi:HSP20 family protein
MKKTLEKVNEVFPEMFDDFFKPWNERFNGNLWGKMQTVPAANISEDKDNYLISLAAPGLLKEDFHIDLEGDMLTISCEKEERKEEKTGKETRHEYNFTSFSRSFTLPEEVMMEKIGATYADGILSIQLPKKDEARKPLPMKRIMIQ